MKLSLRLSTALQNARYDLPLWDICCDHGLLGIQALRSKRFPQVHFVDQVPHLIASLQGKIEARRKDGDAKSFFYATPAESLDAPIKGSVCVLGVGAQKIEIFLRAWEKKNLLQAERLILGPHKDEKWFLEKIIPSLNTYQLQKQIDLYERGRKRSLFILNQLNM